MQANPKAEDHRQKADELMELYCRTRDVQLRNALVENYIYIAQIIAKRFSGSGVDYDDLYQVASLALLRALERFDCSKGVRFPTFATPTMVGEVKNYFRDRYTLIRMPRKNQEMLKKLDDAKAALSQRLGRTPLMEETASEAGIPLELALEALESRAANWPQSLDQRVDQEGELDLKQVLGEDDQNFNKIELRDMIGRLMESVNETERSLLKQRYFEGRSQRDVAARLGVSQMHISRMERKILERLRTMVKRDFS